MTSETPEQPAIPPLPAEPPAAPAPAKKPLTPIAAGLIGLAVGAGLVGGIWAITANSGPSDPSTFTLKGSFELTDSVTPDGNGGCRGRLDSGYDDIAEGTSVTVYGASGDVVATGGLGKSSEDLGTCTFKVSVPDVPTGEKFYKVEVSHRGTLQLTAKEAENGEFAGSLG
ncbi:hypothetical protein SAMN05216532_8180 [Streptomyces sp. 2231.1]|uniref:hypothetical protein n=1 Tax=Streptomyces sp. 2231.1 TaxID=1855347 RepID=UPI00089BA979|nr:hypothetical protein [Streptomyces sp. 2231.1]SEE65599.1 hypothetical protein SAMN05216532_8180 [Streptomyces sp. 2231.1]